MSVTDPWDLDALRVTAEDYRNVLKRSVNKSPSKTRTIYLAGKIAAGDWRHTVVPGLRGALSDSDMKVGTVRWDLLKYRVLNAFDYAGPFFASCDHGCAHGSGGHGVMGGCINDNGHRMPEARAYVFGECMKAIKRCDVFFAWFGEPSCTAYGTLVELGFAKALGKQTITAFSKLHAQARDDLWFASMLAGHHINADDPVSALQKLAKEELEKNAPTESPIEEAFWRAHRRLRLEELAGLVVQHPVLGGKYRLDFALPDPKIGIELDGYEYHGTSRTKFVEDQQRQRTLEADGWRLIRFAGAEVHTDAESCVRQAARHIGALKNGGG